MLEGVVVRSTGSWYEVRDLKSQIIKCRIVGKFRLKGLKLTNPVAVGDIVYFEIEDIEEKTGSIKKIGQRKNYIVRQSPRKKHFLHLIAANIDQAIVIVTIKEPLLKQGFIDRFLLLTEPFDIPAIIVVNKSDLYDENDLNIFAHLKEIYSKIGYEIILTSSIDNENVELLKALLKDKITLISGQSGVGKSSLISCIQSGLELRTAEISDYSGKGQHTTTFAEMFPLDFGGHIIDTPGIKTLSYNNLEIEDVAHNFKEFFAISDQCKFANCMHRNEPHCAVKKAIEVGEISEFRYNNYLLIISEIEDQNYWERVDY